MGTEQTSYTVLARKWRPQTFADVVGQEHVTTTLQHALGQLDLELAGEPGLQGAD